MSISNLLVKNNLNLFANELTTPLFIISGTNNSTSSTTGALTLNGGVGIAKHLVFSGSFNGISNATGTPIIPSGSSQYYIWLSPSAATTATMWFSSSTSQGSGIWQITVYNYDDGVSPFPTVSTLLTSTGTAPNTPAGYVNGSQIGFYVNKMTSYNQNCSFWVQWK